MLAELYNYFVLACERILRRLGVADSFLQLLPELFDREFVRGELSFKLLL